MSWNIPENVFYGGELKSVPIVSIFLGSVGKNLANKPNVYVSSSAGARWREVRVSLLVQSTPHVQIMITGCWFSHFTAPLSLWICVTRLLGVLRQIWIVSQFLGGVHCVGGTWQKSKWQESVPHGCLVSDWYVWEHASLCFAFIGTSRTSLLHLGWPWRNTDGYRTGRCHY